ncbi:ABC transporter substrate-binding protein [Kineococcus terrestris]|uniref:ABC transporter substrate-binding protein n=1 Tax=Kineococcus terrestris TaxID=2044856 RepID=UPI0034DAD041
MTSGRTPHHAPGHRSTGPLLTRRRLVGAGGLGALTLLAAGCGGGSSGGGDGALRFSWWGNADRAADTQAAIDAFEAANPGTTVSGEWADFTGYFDRLATNVAANDAPDVMTLGGAYPREYGDRGALLDLAEVSDALPLDGIDAAALSNGEFSGVQYGVPTGVNTYCAVVNPALFDAAGVALPDDATWTWEEFEALAGDLSAASPEGVVGAVDPTTADALDLFSRQRGEGLYTEDGGLAISAATLEEWWTRTLRMSRDGATPPATITTELLGDAAPEQTLMGRGQAAITLGWSNTLPALRAAAGEPLQLLRAPGESTGQPGMWLQASQLYAISSRTRNREAAARLVDFLVNSPEAGRIIGADRGIPANAEVLAAITPDLDDDQRAQAEFVARVTPLVGDALVIGPVGSTETRGVVERLNADVLFERTTPADAAQAFLDQVGAAIGA